MRLAGPKEYCLSRLHLHIIQHECTKHTYISGILLLQPYHQILHLLLIGLRTTALIPRHEFRELGLQFRFIRGHERVEEVAECGFLARASGCVRGRDGDESGERGGGNEGGKFRCGGDVTRDLGKREEAAERGEGRERDGHFWFMIRICGSL